MEQAENKQYQFKTKWWQRVLALVCVVALMISTFSFLTRIDFSVDDGIGAEALAEGNAYLTGSTTERLSRAAVSFLMQGKDFQRNYELASFYISKADYEMALSYVQRCIDSIQENTDTELMDDLWLKYGCIHAVLGQYEEALAGFRNISEGSQVSAQKEIVSAQIALEKADFHMAYGHLKQYLTLSPEDISVYGLYADCCYYVGEPQEALTWYAKSEEAGISMEGSEYLLWCMSLMDLNEAEPAREKALKALELGYEDAGLCYSQCALCSYSLGEFENALTYGAKALESDSQSVDYGMLILYMGLSAFSLEQYEAALEYFQAAQGLGCVDVQLWYYWGFAQMLLEDYDGAVTWFAKAVDDAAFHDSTCLYRGICYLQLGDIAAARKDLEEALKSKDPSIYDTATELLTQLDAI